MSNKKVVVVSPFFNEQETIRDFIFEVSKVFIKLQKNYDFEIILVNDGSEDKTMHEIKKSKFVVNGTIISLKKNYGHQIALSTGLASIIDSDYIVVLDSDLQDPPEYIEQILADLDRGNGIVLTHRFQRDDQIIKKVTAYIYYRLLRVFTREKFVMDSGDYWGINLNALNKLLSYQKNKMIFFRGQLIKLNLSYSIVEIKRSKRVKGKSKYGLKKMLRLALNGLFCTSDYMDKAFKKKLFVIFMVLLLINCLIILIATNFGISSTLIIAFVGALVMTLYMGRQLRIEFEKQNSEILFEKIVLNAE
jgi:glycosyltransferase involved in cell wall biosynthesis